MHDLNSGYATVFNRRHRRSGSLLQGRFQAMMVQEDGYTWTLSRDVHRNPVRAGAVERPEHYSDYQSLSGLTTDQSTALIHQVEAEIGSAHGTDPLASGLVIAGGGIGPLLGARVTIGGSSRVEGDYSGFRLPNFLPGSTPNANSVGIGGGIAMAPAWAGNGCCYILIPGTSI
jgi:hypothetical protein